MNLTLKIIESYGFPQKTSKPDWDDVQVEYTLPNGLNLTTLTVCNNEVCDVDSLEGLEGFIYINTKEELDALLSKTLEQIYNEIAKEEPEFEIEQYI